MVTKRTCHGTTRKGTSCKAAPLKDGDHCLAHADAKTRESVGFVAANGKGGRPRKPRVVDLMREWVEEHPEAFGVIQEALKAERAIVVGNTKDAYVEYVPDWPTRIVAFKELMDRAYGKAQSTHHIVSTDEFMDRVADMEAEFAALDEQLEAESSSNS